MNMLTKTWLTAHTLHWLATWKRRNTHFRFTLPDNPKFMGPRDAVKLIPDGAAIATSGLAGNQQAQIIQWAIRELYEETGHPRDLTVMSVGGQGGRGKVPGTLEELGLEGLVTRFFSGHLETFKSILKLADAGKCELQCIPQGTLTLLFKAQANGEECIINDTGTGTFIDPRTGRGTPVIDHDAPQYVEIVDGRFKYSIPKITCSYFNAQAADAKGNIYARHNAVIGEGRETSKAAKRHGGLVIANVAELVEEGYSDIYVPAEEVDAVVLYPKTMQTSSVQYRKHWNFFTPESTTDLKEGIARVKHVNNLLGITPRRTPADNALARLAAKVFVDYAHKGDHTDIGVGLPEEASRLLHESGAMEQYTMVNESGVFGGLPAPGIFFGAAVNPHEIITSAEAFTRIYERLDAAMLGALEVDSNGHVNVSKRGDGAINYVGPGGFIDLTECANLILFCASWGDRCKIRIEGGKMHVDDPGKPKFVNEVEEVTFNGQEALKAGKKVFYITHLCAFRLTGRGMELVCVMPGVDVQKDIIDLLDMNVVLPESGEVPEVTHDILTGEGFRLTVPDHPVED